MPLVDITTREGWHAESNWAPAYAIGKGLPPLFITHSKSLLLDVNTPESAVQVNFHEYHRYAINPVDIWVYVLFTEDPPPKSKRVQVRATVETILNALLDEYAVNYKHLRRQLNADDPRVAGMRSDRPTIAIDLFWGPGAGCITYSDGPPLRW